MISIIIPVYHAEESLERLLAALYSLHERMPAPMEVVFVVDGSTDRCLPILRAALPAAPFAWQLHSLSRNFGAWSAVNAGLHHGRGEFFAVMAADLQEPPELMLRFYDVLSSGKADIAIGSRDSRTDPWFSLVCSNLYWALYRRFIVKEIPPGGVDIFAVTREVRDILMTFKEASTSWIALLFWIGFRRELVSYVRAPRLEGKSAWTFAKKLRLASNSIFNFSDLPLQLLMYGGGFGLLVSVVWGCVIVVAKLLGQIDVPGYAAIVVAIGFFGALTSMGLGIIGQYLWLVLQNVRGRPDYIVAESVDPSRPRANTADLSKSM